MHGGKHVHYPSVFTHFIPGVLVGALLGLVFGASIVAGIAQTSLQSYWENNRETQSADAPCVALAGIHTLSSVTPTGGAFTSVILGGQEQSTVLTVPVSFVRTVPTATPYRTLLTLVADEKQTSAFPATSLYVIDGCTATLTHVLGSGEMGMEILGASPHGSLAAFTSDGGSIFALMNVETREVMKPHASVPVGLLRDVEFAPDDSGVALAYQADSSQVFVWDVRVGAVHPVFFDASELPAWGLRTFAEYLAQF